MKQHRTPFCRSFHGQVSQVICGLGKQIRQIMTPVATRMTAGTRMAVTLFIGAGLWSTAVAPLAAAETQPAVASETAPATTAPAPAAATSATPAAPATPATPATQPASESPATMPHIRINREKRWVDFDAKVVLRDGKWIELLVCTPGSREYESILTTEAKPSHIHLALLILGQTPGSPLAWERKDDAVTPIAPTGPSIEISIHYLKDGKPFEIPAGQWVMDQAVNGPLASSTWLFAGSKFMAVEGRPIYTADINGSCISLVNFGDDLLTRPTSQTNHTDNGQLSANTPLIPAVGTNVVIRLKPTPKNQPDGEVKENGKQDVKPELKEEVSQTQSASQD